MGESLTDQPEKTEGNTLQESCYIKVQNGFTAGLKNTGFAEKTLN